VAAVCGGVIGLMLVAAALGAQAPATSVENVAATASDTDVVVRYDLRPAADPTLTFTVGIEASLDGGRTFTIHPRHISGDVGANIRAGTGKRITWEATKETQILRLDRVSFRVIATPTPRAKGTLAVRTTPAKAELGIDGHPIAVAPFTIDTLSFGLHRVAVNLLGFVPTLLSVPVADGVTVTVDLDLIPAPMPGTESSTTVTMTTEMDAQRRRVVIDSEPRGATVTIDNRRRGVTPAEVNALDAGSHTLRLSLSGYEDMPLEIQVVDRLRLTVAAKLRPIGR
jgi:hypothetical protein